MIRVARVLLGVLAVLVALPLLLAGVALWAAMQHRADDGSFTAPLAPVHAAGYAVLVPDVDALLRREAPFVRGGQTTLRFTARAGGGPAFVGLAPRAAVEKYLTGVSYAAVTRVRLARGGLPVSTSPVAGAQPAAPPVDQTFWLVSSTSGTLFWSPSSLRGEHLALVVMTAAGAPVGEVLASAAMTPRWLDPTTYGLLILGTVAFLIGMVLLFWPRRHREIVYVVEPSQVPEIAARLGISTEPLAAALGGAPEPGAVPDPDPEEEPAGTVVEPPAWLVEPDRVGAPPAEPRSSSERLPIGVRQPAPVSPASLMGGGVVVGIAPPLTDPIWNAPTPVPVPAGPPGTYRSFSAPAADHALVRVAAGAHSPVTAWPPASSLRGATSPGGVNRTIHPNR